MRRYISMLLWQAYLRRVERSRTKSASAACDNCCSAAERTEESRGASVQGPRECMSKMTGRSRLGRTRRQRPSKDLVDVHAGQDTLTIRARRDREFLSVSNVTCVVDTGDQVNRVPFRRAEVKKRVGTALCPAPVTPHAGVSRHERTSFRRQMPFYAKTELVACTDGSRLP
ncbi:hypothetical protein ES702_06468 [subsurface metagenome]